MRPNRKRKTPSHRQPTTILRRKRRLLRPEDIFPAALASCMNTLFLLTSENSMLSLKNLDTEANVKMNVEGMEKLIFTNMHFTMNVKLEENDERERIKAERAYEMAQKICPLRQSWGEDVPISFELNFKQKNKTQNSYPFLFKGKQSKKT
jgi:organic hydroperoxide reductase OsmC/OhrA